jgi:hypothetical protein
MDESHFNHVLYLPPIIIIVHIQHCVIENERERVRYVKKGNICVRLTPRPRQPTSWRGDVNDTPASTAFNDFPCGACSN